MANKKILEKLSIGLLMGFLVNILVVSAIFISVVNGMPDVPPMLELSVFYCIAFACFGLSGFAEFMIDREMEGENDHDWIELLKIAGSIIALIIWFA